uniref:tRNA (adenine(58)-N(1))-methyltransferase non-catalytic subunit TRM6 n=1 Tax=Anthurium amnicola TaxID=1678845 RepID=A0A1D1Y8F8_9ARAE
MGDQGGGASCSTWEGCSVLLDINDGDRLVFARLSPSAFVKIGNKRCPLRPLVGCPFGSLFQVETGPEGPHLVRVSSAPTTQDIYLQEEDDERLKVHQNDNRVLIDDNKAQSLTGEDIDAMRRDGVSGSEIIEALIANSSTFEKKTVFSQEKYRLRKQKKYAPKVLLRRPFARSICEAYFKKHASRIGPFHRDGHHWILQPSKS